jgi:hypothetical protein
MPPVHHVKNNELSINSRYNAVEIYKLLKEHGLSHPNFDKYEKSHKLLEQEEIEECRNLDKLIEKNKLIHMEEEKRKQEMIVRFSSKNRIERLKLKNNIKPNDF